MSTAPVGQNLTRRYGRQWEVSVRTPDEWITLSSSDPKFAKNGQTPLRVKFDIWQPANYGAFWYGNISVFNLSQETQQTLLAEGMDVIVNAGYSNGPYGEIFNGKVFQPMWGRETVVDFETKLRCFIGREVLSESMIICNRAAFATQDDLVRQMANNATTPLVYNQNGVREPVKFTVDADPVLQQKKMVRGKTYFGPTRKYYDQVANDNFLQWWFGSDNRIHLRDIRKDVDPKVLSYTPDTGIVGTPEQTQEGVNFRLLLDPRVQVKYPTMQIKLNMSAIRQLERTVGQTPTFLDKDATYLVAGVRHVGDTRGQQWYTEVIGVNSHYGAFSLLTGLESSMGAPTDNNR